MATEYTPRELELMVKRELGAEVSEGVIVQIVRDGEHWTARSRFSSHSHSRDREEEISRRIEAIGARLSKNHRLIG